jgi:hypothetical protein
LGCFWRSFSAWGLIEDQTAAVEEAAAVLAEGITKQGKDSPFPIILPKRLAGQLLDRNIIILWGG